METISLYEKVFNEIADAEKEYIRYLSRDIAFLKELREEYIDEKDWEKEQTISAIIHDEIQLMDSCKRRWNVNRTEREKFKRLCGAGSGDQQPRNGYAFEGEAGLDTPGKIQKHSIAG